MVCACHEAQRMEGKKITCPQDSRRLFEAHDKIIGFVKELTTEANNLPLAASEGNAGLHTELVNAMRGAASTVSTRFKYLGVVPWAFSQVCRVSGARDCLTQYDARPVGEHDSLTVAIMVRKGA